MEAENLNYKTGKSWCYDNKESNCDNYGRLYDWNTAMKACPVGWHLPARQEWNDLVNAVGGKKVAGRRLKSKNGWKNHKKHVGTDDYGFSALPGGFYPGSYFNDAGNYGSWWSATEYGSENAYRRGMFYNNEGVNESSYYKCYGCSVRCLQD